MLGQLIGYLIKLFLKLFKLPDFKKTVTSLNCINVNSEEQDSKNKRIALVVTILFYRPNFLFCHFVKRRTITKTLDTTCLSIVQIQKCLFFDEM